MTNTKINDNEMEQVNGGITLDELNNHGMKDYDAFGVVKEQVKSGYIVTKEDGEEIFARNNENRVLAPGTPVALINKDGEWIAEEQRVF